MRAHSRGTCPGDHGDLAADQERERGGRGYVRARHRHNGPGLLGLLLLLCIFFNTDIVLDSARCNFLFL